MSRTASVLAWLSGLETLSFLTLLAAMADGSEAGVSVTGMIHGLLFAAYALVIWIWRGELGWSFRFAALTILTGPVGAILTLERLRRERRVPPSPLRTARGGRLRDWQPRSQHQPQDDIL